VCGVANPKQENFNNFFLPKNTLTSCLARNFTFFLFLALIACGVEASAVRRYLGIIKAAKEPK
jgi:hypothetical protein